MRYVTGFLGGAALWVFMYWLAGFDIPSERGATAVFYVFELAACGFIGICFAKGAEYV